MTLLQPDLLAHLAETFPEAVAWKNVADGRALGMREWHTRSNQLARGLQARTTLAAAKGAVAAYLHAIGEEWKPYTGNNEGVAQVVRGAAAAQMAAFS